MRKIVAILVGLAMLFFVPAFGEEIDLSSMASDELTALRKAIDKELLERNGIADTMLHPGAYTVGKSIEAGNYTLSYCENSNKYSMPAGIGVYLDSEKYRAGDNFSYTVLDVGMSAFVELTEGMVVEIDNSSLYIEKMDDMSGGEKPASIAADDVRTESDDGKTISTTPQSTTGVTPEFKALMDEYEVFFDYYIELVNGMASGDLSISLIGEYSKMMIQYEETMAALDRIKEEELSDADSYYYTEASLRIMQKLASASE